MSTEDVIAVSGVDHVYGIHRPRLLSENGPCYISGELKKYLVDQGFTHTRGKPCHPMTQGKIERYHRSMKNGLLLNNSYSPDDLKAEIAQFVDHHNHRRHHESLDNVTPADAYTGQAAENLEQREQTKRETTNRTKVDYRKAIAMRQIVSWLKEKRVRIV